ncbi:growth arrest and DNA damage-inducible protein GADD45 gamma isoform X1 [Mustela nigripes]|uniref:growth arrest and DNA damage-inducible protein GADD45 gamma isoform X1 n=1 Tax=Mustela nigripes TaxID=77151 RepID=UPI002815E7A1|nr:growth arrest and DNA damage-inducible protein GADD45 gamma isoform X1 [Mustela nigripes]
MGNRWAGAGLRRCVSGAGAPGRGAGVGVCSGLGTPPRLLAGAAHRAGSVRRMQGAGKALHELLLSAQRQGCLTAGVYESAKVLNVDPDNVTFCVLAADAEDEGDIALQIHFTLIQAFCCENDIDIVRVGDVQRLAAIVGAGDEAAAPGDLHCILISNPNEDAWKDPALEKLSVFCEESRRVNDWVPSITLPE